MTNILSAPVSVEIKQSTCSCSSDAVISPILEIIIDMISLSGIHGSSVDDEDMKYAVYLLVLKVHFLFLSA
ncbi:MAG: hypothetical protein BWY05_01540 [Euryarchaeota archaeon ADurb.Bin165]|nr:MAG: hypothetical protein BWY05_01540 [Euryarchaeota archaeon ADurb.Bin165]